MTLIEACDKVGYKIDKNNQEAVTKVCQYLQNPDEKGLLFIGYYGTGKTWLMRIIDEYFTPVNIVSTERIIQDTVNQQDVKQRYRQRNLWYFMNGGKVDFVDWPYCFDELGGQNDRKVNIYGNEIYPMSVILKAHYEKKIKCHAITNYDPESQEMKRIYGGEVVDRFKEMFHEIKFKGDSRR